MLSGISRSKQSLKRTYTLHFRASLDWASLQSKYPRPEGYQLRYISDICTPEMLCLGSRGWVWDSPHPLPGYVILAVCRCWAWTYFSLCTSKVYIMSNVLPELEWRGMEREKENTALIEKGSDGGRPGTFPLKELPKWGHCTVEEIQGGPSIHSVTSFSNT